MINIDNSFGAQDTNNTIIKPCMCKKCLVNYNNNNVESYDQNHFIRNEHEQPNLSNQNGNNFLVDEYVDMGPQYQPDVKFCQSNNIRQPPAQCGQNPNLCIDDDILPMPNNFGPIMPQPPCEPINC